MRLGVFGGAFNPVHNGHVNLARRFIEILSLDRLLVIPTANPPHRSTVGFAPAQNRFEMLSLAFDGIKEAKISDIEFKRKGKNYTSDTVDELKRLYPDAEIYLIIGSDQFLYFDKWYRYKELLGKVTVCTAPREKITRNVLEKYAREKLCGGKYYIADFEPLEISSSEIREKLQCGEDVSLIIPPSVYNYIKEKELYGV